ncbi:MAG: flagellar biosynthetic protein FliO [Treponema sp.]|nr:flagellar biosynthetic protein FliO [Treponema sp.]
MGGEKLKDRRRIVYIAVFFVYILINVFFLSSFLSAQSAEVQGETALPGAAEDPIAAAERALTLDEDTPEGAAVPSGGPGTFSILLRIVLMLLVVAAAIYGVIWFLKRAARPPAGRDPYLKVLSTVPLGTGRFVHVVALGSQAWLVGSGEGGTRLIAELRDQNILNAMLLENSRQAGPGGRFGDFKSLLRRFGVEHDNSPPGADDIRRRRDRIQGL